MPNLASELLSRLGINLPDPPSQLTPSQQALQDQVALRTQASNPAWKQVGSQAIDATSNVAKGLLGIDPDPNESNGGYIANALTQLGGVTKGLTEAGLPFAAIRGNEPVFHGTSKVFEKFDPKRYDTSDVLGWLTHFAEDPKYAEKYATGEAKHSYIYDEHGNPVLNRRENIIPANIKAQNVLDLVHPNMDDMSQAIAALSPIYRNNLIMRYKNLHRGSDNIESMINDYISPRHIDDYTRQQPFASYLAENIRLDPEALKRSPFDAIRYRDMGEKSWAIPETTPIESKFGTPLNDPPKPIKVIKSDQSSGGTLTPIENKGKMIVNKYSGESFSLADMAKIHNLTPEELTEKIKTYPPEWSKYFTVQ